NGRWLVVVIEALQEVSRMSIPTQPAPPGEWTVVANNVPVCQRVHQTLVAYELGGADPVRVLQHTTTEDNQITAAIVLDDGAVIAVRGRDLCEWLPDGAIQTQHLFETDGRTELYLRPDGRQLVAARIAKFTREELRARSFRRETYAIDLADRTY